MSIKKLFKALIITVIVLTFLGSLGLNYALYQLGHADYLELNRVRLDPLGLKTFSNNSETITPGSHEKLVVIFGDSRAADWPAPETNNITFINRGIGAQTTAQVLERFQYHIAPLQPDIILIQVGINDLKTIPLFPEQREQIVADTKAHISQIVNLSQELGAHVILTTVFYPSGVPVQRALFWSDEVNPAITEVNNYIISLQADDVEVFDAATLLVGASNITASMYSKDFLHLNSQGYATLNQELSQILAH